MVTYKDAGVDIEAGEKTVDLIKGAVKSTYNDNVVKGVGSFGGMFALSGLKEPVLVSSIDGVGTKLKVAYLVGKHDTVGQDLVNHCVNDILVQGAKPLFFLDYLGTGKLDPSVAADVISGFAVACKENGCVLIGGETAEMPGIYNSGEYDVAGCIVGAVERGDVIDGSSIAVGDKVYAFMSTGLHTNGYSLARKVLLEKFSVDDHVEELGCTLGEALLRVHKSYLSEVLPQISKVKGMAHITGGGLVGNIPRVLPEGVDVCIDKSTWDVPAIFTLIQKEGDVSEEEMFKAFNMGIGFVVISDEEISGAVCVGEVVEGSGKVLLR